MLVSSQTKSGKRQTRDVHLDVLHQCLESSEAIGCDWTFWTSPVPVGRTRRPLRTPGVWQFVIVLGMRLGNLSLTCLIRQDSDCHSAPPGKMD